MPIHHHLLGKLPTTTDRIRNYLADDELGAKHCSAHENVLKPGAEVPAHLHGVEEVIVCLEGEAECTLGDAQPVKYQSGSVVIIPPNTSHIIRIPAKPISGRSASLPVSRQRHSGSRLKLASATLAAMIRPNPGRLGRLACDA